MRAAGQEGPSRTERSEEATRLALQMQLALQMRAGAVRQREAPPTNLQVDPAQPILDC